MALRQVRSTRILHLTIARVLEARAKARPLAGRCGGYSDAELRALHPEVRPEEHPLTRAMGAWSWDEDRDLWTEQAAETVVHAADVSSSPADRLAAPAWADEEVAEDVFGFGGGLDSDEEDEDTEG